MSNTGLSLKHGVIFFIATLLAASASYAERLPDVPHLSLQVRGEVEAEPDIAHIRLQITEINKSASIAKTAVDERVAAVLKLLNSQKIQREDMSSSQLRVSPEYQWHDRKRTLLGQRVQQSVSFTLRDLSRYAALLDGLLAVNISELGQVSFDLSQRGQLKDEALQLAMREAHRKAAVLAKGFNSQLGGVFHVEEVAGRVARPMMQAMAMDAKRAAPEVMFGMQAVSSELRVVFLLKPQ
ncbi:MAG: SIMPL domain-containing protein [Spongiibacteraceae bacterium]